MEALATFEEWAKVEIVNKYPLALSMQIADELAGTFATMSWCLCRALSGACFITSDAPVCKFLKTGEGRGLFGGGLGHPAAQVTFPLSPEACLLLDWTHRQHRIRVGRQFVDEVNRRTAFHAERWVIPSHRSTAMASLVTESSKTRTMPKIDRDRIRNVLRQVRERRRMRPEK